MSKNCGDCKWLQRMKYENLTVCKNKDSNWYVRNQDEAACKHFEKREEHYEVNTHTGDHLDPANNHICGGTVEVRKHSCV